MSVKDTIKYLQEHKTNLCCEDVKRLLESLGFKVADKKAGHKVFKHDELPFFQSSSFNCGHGKNPEIKSSYIINIIKVLKQYQEELEDYLKEKQ